jgi:hypothetical protein
MYIFECRHLRFKLVLGYRSVASPEGDRVPLHRPKATEFHLHVVASPEGDRVPLHARYWVERHGTDIEGDAPDQEAEDQSSTSHRSLARTRRRQLRRIYRLACHNNPARCVRTEKLQGNGGRLQRSSRRVLESRITRQQQICGISTGAIAIARQLTKQHGAVLVAQPGGG